MVISPGELGLLRNDDCYWLTCALGTCALGLQQLLQLLIECLLLCSDLRIGRLRLGNHCSIPLRNCNHSSVQVLRYSSEGLDGNLGGIGNVEDGKDIAGT